MTTLILGGIVGALVAISMGLSVLAELRWRIPVSAPFRNFALVGPLREAGTVALVFAAFLVVHRILPDRPLPWQWLWPGSLATILLMGAEISRCWALSAV